MIGGVNACEEKSDLINELEVKFKDWMELGSMWYELSTPILNKW